MVKFTVQPVLLLVGLIIINGMLVGIIQDIFNYYVCFKCTLPITFAIPGYPQVGTVTLFCVSWFSAWGSDNVDSASIKGLVTSVPLAITFCMITTIMRVYADKIAGDVSKSITGSMGGMTTGGGNRSMGLNPFAGMDKQAGSFASFVGKEEEYKEMKLKMRKSGAQALKGVAKGVVAANLPGPSSLYAANKLRSKVYTAIKSKFGKEGN